jgi:hypothetical protein
MYGKLLYAFGIAFTLFIVIMFAGALFRSGFSGILKFFFSRLLMIFFIITVCLGIGILIYSLVTGVNAVNTVETFLEFLKEQWSQL